MCSVGAKQQTFCASVSVLQIMMQTDLDERGAAKEESKHVGHNVITDHTGNWHYKPIQTRESSHQLNVNTFYERDVW